jgi:hypothetical protein
METIDAFDGWLEAELGRQLVDASGRQALPAPRYRSVSGPRRSRFRLAGIAGLPLAVSLKGAAALAAAALAVGGASVIEVQSHLRGDSAGSRPPSAAPLRGGSGAADPTGSPSASAHGSAMATAVATCKAARPSPDASTSPQPGSRGIGDCVSAIASDGRAGGTSSGGAAGGNDKGNGNGDGDGNGTHPTPDPHPTPHPHPTPPVGHPTPPPHP